MPLPELLPRRQQSFVVESPNLGIYLGRSALDIPDRGLSSCLNVRIQDRKITNENVGYELLFAQALGNQVLMIDEFKTSAGAITTIFGTKTDLFRYDSAANEPLYITPIYTTGTAAGVNGSDSVTGASSPLWQTGGVKSGDFIHFGSATQNDPSETWYEILTVDTESTLTLTANFAEASTGQVVYTIRSTFTANDTDYWFSDVFPDAPAGTTSSYSQGDRWFATNDNELVAWDGSGTTVEVISTASTGLGFSCKTLTYYKNMMLYGSLVESGTSKPVSFKNTAIGDPENVTTLEANEFILAQGIDFLLSFELLGDYVVAYCENSINIVQFVSAPFYFAIRTVMPSVGIYAGRCIVNFGDFHEFIGTDQPYKFDGVRLVPYANHVFDEVLRISDRDRSSKSVAFLSKEEQEVYWILPLSTDGSGTDKGAEIAWTEHYSEQTGRNPVPFTKREIPATAVGTFTDAPVGRWSDFSGDGFDDVTFRFNDRFFTSAFPVVLFGDENGVIRKLNTQTGQDSSPTMLSGATLPERPLVDGSDKGIIRRIEPHLEKIDSSGDMSITAFTRERPNGTHTAATQSLAIDHSGLRYAPFRLSGRYASATFFTTTAGNIWVLDGYRVVSEAMGQR